MSNTFLNAIQNRRSIYALDANTTLRNAQITETIQTAIAHAPSAFNSQTTKAVVLYGEESTKLWNLVLDALRKVTPEAAFADTEAKINSFDAGVGTVLFFEDTSIVKGLQEAFALYADNFPIWSEQAAGISQFSVWTALAQENVGASLQHYSNLIEAQVAEAWNIPAEWKLTAQMPFGNIAAPAGEKEFAPIADRVKVYGE